MRAARQRRRRVDGGHAQAAGVDHAGRDLVPWRQRDDGVAPQRGGAGRARIDEARGAARLADVLHRRVLALQAVAVEQGVARAALQQQRQLPAQVVGVLDAAVAAARAERRDQMRRVAREQHVAVAQAVQAFVAVGPDAMPGDVEFHAFAQQVPDALAHGRVGGGRGRVLVRTQLEVQAPGVVGHLVAPDGAAVVAAGVQPGPAFFRPGRVAQHDVDDDPAVLGLVVHARTQAQHAAHRALGAVAGNHPLRAAGVGAVGRLHLQGRRAAGLRLDPGDAVQPAQLGQRLAHQRVDQEGLQVVLLQVDEAVVAHVGLVLQGERGHRHVAAQHAAHVPAHALADHGIGHSQAVEDVQRALRPDHAARGQAAHADGVVVVQHDHRNAAAHQIQGQRQAGQSGPHDGHRVRIAAGAVHFLGPDVRVDGKLFHRFP
ncbi:hypothetical protein LMG26858_05992 [Achromobacter anxifer]|uniref:Uncharacterized protein n=1 Tax=Achromobacter anxifer TaxID=1287737 RepID=A0A6S7F1S5_9BURK|nr:hypothetical protein LMG26858_05992 [Achromobacter anxifer]